MDDDNSTFISLDSPPPSPTIQISFESFSTSQQTVTPTRKRRHAGGERLRVQKPAPPMPVLNIELSDEPDWGEESASGASHPPVDAADDPLVAIEPGGAEEAARIGGDGYDAYCTFVQEEGGAFYQIGPTLFVVNGWDATSKTSKASWYHLQRTFIADELVIVCKCPSSKPEHDCVHQRFLRDHGNEHFPMTEDVPDETTVLFSRQELDNDEYLNVFSTLPSNSRSLNARIIVEYSGRDTREGRWMCAKDQNQHCAHIRSCYSLFQKLVDPAANEEALLVHALPLDYTIVRSRRSVKSTRAVSYLSILPPAWATLPTDSVLYTRPPPLTSHPSPLTLTDTSSCGCTLPRTMFGRDEAVVWQRCTVYGLARSWETSIQLRRCPNTRCYRRFVGPDCREVGIFNYNNERLFAHDLLDDYTSAYTTSETPFSAWVLVISRRYRLHGLEFPSADIFRTVWFSYVALQKLEADMSCPRCGTTPETTIWDGVTLAFNRKHLLPTLEPPTAVESLSSDRRSKYLASQQVIPDRKTRQLVKLIISGTPLTMELLRKTTEAVHTQGAVLEDDEAEEDEGDDEDEVDQTPSRTRAQRTAVKLLAELTRRLDAIPSAVEALATASPGLSRIFNARFGELAVARGEVAPDVYRRFFKQVVAEESVLQMLTAPAMGRLQQFIATPTTSCASALVEIPALYDVLRFETQHGNFPFVADLTEICAWLLTRGQTILHALMLEPQPPQRLEAMVEAEKAWTETGCYYSLPKIRARPRYPKLKHDASNEVGGKRGAKCSKFYAQYGERRLTGGIMCVWCTHSICYGFHCIPRGEGRNDVFSALITRWETAPKRIIYDFACALGPYCMTREPEFFSKTQFLIDDFHSVGHTKCSEAAFLKTHCNVDPRLGYINSSAGECGNSGLARIRKSVSYMSQSRAIVYTKVFLSIWNRQRIRAMYSA
ncbi:hypothetical protein MKEN_00325600 [Mycena kentingensis (nom. inval.)]|nr:hypothetical protein MKEN_00325600 [Mycena kentingensis (nom. inval.)]